MASERTEGTCGYCYDIIGNKTNTPKGSTAQFRRKDSGLPLLLGFARECFFVPRKVASPASVFLFRGRLLTFSLQFISRPYRPPRIQLQNSEVRFRSEIFRWLACQTATCHPGAWPRTNGSATGRASRCIPGVPNPRLLRSPKNAATRALVSEETAGPPFDTGTSFDALG